MEPTCSFMGCDRPTQARGLCHSHYVQQCRTGALGPLHRRTLGTPQERLDAFTERTDGCWLWTGSKRNGYGQIRVGDRALPAHRVAYELANGVLPDGVKLDRQCPNRACVRPDHWLPSTRKPNASGVPGVTWDPRAARWRAQIRHDGRNLHVGRFDTVEEASAAIAVRRRNALAHDLPVAKP